MVIIFEFSTIQNDKKVQYLQRLDVDPKSEM